MSQGSSCGRFVAGHRRSNFAGHFSSQIDPSIVIAFDDPNVAMPRELLYRANVSPRHVQGFRDGRVSEPVWANLQAHFFSQLADDVVKPGAAHTVVRFAIPFQGEKQGPGLRATLEDPRGDGCPGRRW